jgi:hypothetical protein
MQHDLYEINDSDMTVSIFIFIWRYEYLRCVDEAIYFFVQVLPADHGTRVV